MARKETIINLVFDAEPLAEGAADATLAMEGLGKAVKSLQIQLDSTFSGTQVNMDQFSKKLSDALLTLRLNLGKLKKALTEAFAPVAAVAVNALNTAVRAATRFAQSLGLVLGALFGGAAGNDALADSAERAEESMAAAGKAARRSLAGFDQINRLNGADSGSTGTMVQVSTGAVTDTLSPQLQAMVDKLLALLEPVRNMDFTPLQESLGHLGEAFAGLGDIIGEHLEWLWFNVLVPLGTWVVEEAAPASVELLTAAFEALGKALEPVLAGIRQMVPYLEPVVAFIGEFVITTLEGLRAQFEKVGQTFEEKGGKIQGIFSGIGQIISVVWEQIQPILGLMQESWSEAMDFFGTQLSTAIGVVVDILYGLVEFIAGVLTGDWERAWGGLEEMFKGFVNGVIGLLNGLISKLASGLNTVIRGLNKFSFDIPDWDIFGSLAGKEFGLNLKTISAPQIPYLARGAVLPANRPFLAMVGDQRHGTNVEAPLSTIQEAVALVMDDMIASNLAGQEAIVGVLRQILEAVLGIRIGDRQIAEAVDRYNRKMAVVRGGYL